MKITLFLFLLLSFEAYANQCVEECQIKFNGMSTRQIKKRKACLESCEPKTPTTSMSDEEYDKYLKANGLPGYDPSAGTGTTTVITSTNSLSVCEMSNDFQTINCGEKVYELSTKSKSGGIRKWFSGKKNQGGKKEKEITNSTTNN